MEYIYSEKAPKAIGPYSQATVFNDIVYCSGQIAINPETGEMLENDIVKQTEQVLKNLSEVLKEAGSDLECILKANVYIRNMEEFLVFNEVYSKFITKKPARAVVEVSKLPKNALVEIDCIAYKKI